MYAYQFSCLLLITDSKKTVALAYGCLHGEGVATPAAGAWDHNVALGVERDGGGGVSWQAARVPGPFESTRDSAEGVH